MGRRVIEHVYCLVRLVFLLNFSSVVLISGSKYEFFSLLYTAARVGGKAVSADCKLAPHTALRPLLAHAGLSSGLANARNGSSLEVLFVLYFTALTRVHELFCSVLPVPAFAPALTTRQTLLRRRFLPTSLISRFFDLYFSLTIFYEK